MIKSKIAHLGHLKSYGLPVCLLLLGFVLRVHDLTGTPPGLDGDETFYFFDASRVLHGEYKIYFETNFGHEPLFIYTEALLLRLVGDHAFVLRYTAVLGGMLLLALSYALGRRLFNRRTALVTLVLFATVFWPVFLTRVGLRAFTFPLVSQISVYALWRALQNRSWRWTLAAGAFGGLTLYTYLASRIFPAIILLWLLLLLVFDRGWLRGNWLRVGVALGLATLIVAPFGVFALRNPDVVNQRLYTMGGPFYEVQRGQFAGLEANGVKVLGMFTVQGDPEARYNVGARPVFDPLTGALFYLGLLIALSRWRRPAYYLLWVWLIVALLPTVLAQGAPSFLRASGALFPILTLPGIAADWLFERLHQWRPILNWEPAFVPALLLGAIGLGAWTTSLMFGAWRTSPVVMATYESDLYLAAGYLDQHPPPPDANVVVVAAYAADSAPVMFNLQSRWPIPVRFTSTFVWPAGGGETWYFFSQEALPDDQARAWLGVPPVYRALNQAGNTVLEVYRLPAPPALPQPESTVQARFDHLLDLIGVNYIQPMVRGQSGQGLLFWRVRSHMFFDLHDLPQVRVSLRSGHLEWSESGGWLAYPPPQWKAGDVWVQRFQFNLPADMPPQSIQPEVTLFTRTGEWPVIPGNETLARTQFSLPAVAVTGRPTALAPPSSTPHFGDALALLAANASSASVEPGLPLFVKTTWQALRDLDQDYVLQMQLVGPEGGEAALVSHTLLQEVYPTHRWRQGEQVSSNDALEVLVEAQTGDYRLRIRLVDARGQPLDRGEWVEVGSVQIMGRAHLFSRPPVDVELEAQFGDVARLVGYRLNLDAARGGGGLRLTLVWQALQPSAKSLKVFTHLYGLIDTIKVYAQHDGEPAGGQVLTSTWLPGEYVEDEHVIVIDPSVPPGDYRLGVGMYDPELLRRLPILSDGITSDALILTHVKLP